MTSEFHETIAIIPFVANENHATGIVAPIMRATGHILYLVGALAEPGYTLTGEEVERELSDAKAHLAHTIAATAQVPCSRRVREQIGAFALAVHVADAEITNWPDEERGPNLRALADRAASLGSLLDRELFGYPTSDPGRSL